jgi:hypothetical protein
MYALRRKYFTDKYMIQISKKGERTYVPNLSYVYPNPMQIFNFFEVRIFIKGMKGIFT